MRADDVVLPLIGKPLACCNSLGVEVVISWKVGKKKQHRNCIVKITECVSEGGVALFDDMVKFNLGLVISLETLCIGIVPTAEGFVELFGEGFVFAEFFEDGLVK